MNYYDEVEEKDKKSYLLKLTNDKKLCDFCGNEMNYEINDNIINWTCTCGNFETQDI